MKKLLSLVAILAISINSFAQLAWDTEFTKDDFNNALTVISKTGNVSWPLTGGLQVGTISVFSDWSDECVVALPQTGVAEKLNFAWHGGSGGTVSVYQSTDHNNWSQVFTSEGNANITAKDEEVALATSTKYLKFAASGRLVAATFRRIKVSELKSLAVNIDEWEAKSGMVDDATVSKNITVTWTNVIASVTSTNPQFTASVESVGQKNLIDQKTTITIFYSHAVAGEHSGEIVISGEGREARIAVSGTTSKYEQEMVWNQTLSECLATDELSFNAYTTNSKLGATGLDVVYLSSDTTIAKVQNNELHIRRSGTVTLTATQPGNYKFNAAQPIEKTLVIHKADPNVVASVEDLTYGQRLKEAVLHENNGFVPGTLSWLDIDTNTILDAGDYNLKVLFTPADTGIYNLRTLDVALRVNKAVQTITWEEQETELTVGQLVASTATLSSGLPITYAYTACLLSIEDGLITPENEGEVTVIAYHPGNHNYLPTTVIMQTFVISAAQQQITTNVGQLTPEQQAAARKFLHGGQVYLHYNGCLYDAKGVRVE